MDKFKNAFEYAPLRTLDDFLLESARFQIPNINDVEKWGRRVTSNLLYYQSNYFLMSLIIIIIFGVLHPIKMFTGTLVMGVVAAIFCYLTNESGPVGQFKRKHPVISAIGGFSLAYYIASTMMGSLIIFLLGILLPFCATFIHASLRLRNIKNKIMNQIEHLGLKKTPMGIFLDEMGLEIERQQRK